MRHLTLIAALAVFALPAVAEEAPKASDSAIMDKCIKACEECHKACTACAKDLDKDSKHKKHAAMCWDCAGICKLAVESMKRGGHAHVTICDACAKVCDMCSKMCEKMEGDVHQKAAKSAKDCAAACREMVKAHSK